MKIALSPNLDGLFMGLFCGGCDEVVGGGGQYCPCLKFSRVMLETWNLAGKYTHVCSFRKYLST